MKELFEDILQLDEVQGVMFVRRDGNVGFSAFQKSPPGDVRKMDWSALTTTLADIQEVELLFETCWIYLRQSESGLLVVVTGRYVPTAMVRLNCDIVLPSLESQESKPKGLRRFFGRK